MYLMDEDTLERIKLYLERTKRADDFATAYPLEERGLFFFYTGIMKSERGTTKWGQTKQIVRVRERYLVSGRFIDVVAFCVQHHDYYTYGERDDETTWNGFVVRARSRPSKRLKKDRSLTDLVGMLERFLKRPANPRKTPPAFRLPQFLLDEKIEIIDIREVL